MDLVNKLLANSPPPPPPFPPPTPPAVFQTVLDEDLPEIEVFLGTIVFFLAFFSTLVELCESEELLQVIRFEDFEYRIAPIYLLFGLLVGTVSFALAYAQFDNFSLVSAGHTLLESFMIYFFIKHVSKAAETPNRRTNTLSMFSVLPFFCLAAIEAEHVSVRNCGFFYTIIVTISGIPLVSLLRDWRSNSFGENSKNKKRLFFLCFSLFSFLITMKPSRICARNHTKESEHRSLLVLIFDLLQVYLAMDNLWT
jgi:hypothetical protein